MFKAMTVSDECKPALESMYAGKEARCVVYMLDREKDQVIVVKSVKRDPDMEEEKQFESIVQELLEEKKPYFIVWDLEPSKESGVDSGVYFMNLCLDDFPTRVKMEHSSVKDMLKKELPGLQGEATVDTKDGLEYNKFISHFKN
ncbi:uncharacterized protein LOC143288822 [Babylonia areolata]|uniref:uncharacterized protein LOC143288822 n=1 Tax=Babylonia areolata TaxID=304850 RepID=UPI003FCF0B01